MNAPINKKHHLLAIWSAVPMAILFGGGLIVAGFLPPHSPTASAADIAAIYQSDHGRIVSGQIMMMLAAVMYIPFSAAIGFQMARIEGQYPILAVTQTLLGLATGMLLLLPTIVFATAAFRLERDASFILALNDLGWIGFIWTMSAPLLQYLVIGICILSDKRTDPILPRWVGFYNLWFALLMWGGALVPLFKGGPFAWNGFLAWWLIVSVYFGWLVIMVTMLIKAVNRETSSTVGMAGAYSTGASSQAR